MRLGLRIALVVVVAVVIQTTIFVGLDVFGVAPELVLLIAVLSALVAGPQLGALVGFSGGLLYDAFLETPFALAALSYCITAYAIGSMRSAVPEGDRRLTMAIGAGGSATGVAVFAALGEILGQSTMSDHPAGRIILVSGLLGGVMSIPVMPVVTWMLEPASAERRRPNAVAN